MLYTHPGLAADLRLPQIPVVSKVFTVVAAFGDHDSHHGSTSRDEGRSSGIPARYRALYKKAADGSCVNWRVLAAIGKVESDHGRNAGRSSAGALGPMQFMPATWRAYGRDGNHDGRRDIRDPADAIPAAAHYLCANGAARNLRGAIWHYNHSWNYVDLVLATAGRVR